MRYLYPFERQINLFVEGRIAREDAKRQEHTAKEILRRIYRQPGVILADEVGMGKTFVALAVAVSVAIQNRGRRPVVVMVPPSLKQKWPTDFELFREKCIPPDLRARLSWGRAERAVEFLKLLDDPPERRKSLLFVTHGAMSRGLSDGWVKLALIYQALRQRRDLRKKRRSLSRFAGSLLQMKWVERNGIGVWEELLRVHPSRWLGVLHRWKIDPENDDNPDTDDDPVPRAVLDILHKLDVEPVYECLQQIPERTSKYVDQRIRQGRRVLNHELRTVWTRCLNSLHLKLPLLILDEAHHLKNAQTRLASLFHVPDAEDDANEIERGPLGGVFERMLFLTATPFQLGHGELCSVLDRFDGVRWGGKFSLRCGYAGQRRELRDALDRAQEAAVTLDTAWGRLHRDDLHLDGRQEEDVERWWSAVQSSEELPPAVEQVRRCYASTSVAMETAEKRLRPWVIRHLKNRTLPDPFAKIPRRRRLVGRSICDEQYDGSTEGLPVARSAILPFLLAARATTHAPESRPVFAEGLASSYEAFLHTRRNKGDVGEENATDFDDDEPSENGKDLTDASLWYLRHLHQAVPKGDTAASASHPKIGATTSRALDFWRAGEKVVVFCHYIRTGRVLRQTISEAINQEIVAAAAKLLGCDFNEAGVQLARLGDRFFQDSPIRRACDQQISELLRKFDVLSEHHDAIIEVVRRNLRTPSFLVRFFPIGRSDFGKDAVTQALNHRDQSGLTLRHLLEEFFRFLAERCGAEDRRRYIDAMSRIQTGTYLGADAIEAYDEDELQGARPDRLNPTVRLVNGQTKSDSRQRLMLAFNTPFFPEVLVASSVMAEGVDLHLNCRYMIHHDLCWNPSTLEQRTGRIDRIGAKAERAGKSIGVYLPYIAATQDEKMYRVVMDRERWFSVLMGEDYKTDARTTDRLAERIPFPETAARALAFRLEVTEQADG